MMNDWMIYWTITESGCQCFNTSFMKYTGEAVSLEPNYGYRCSLTWCLLFEVLSAVKNAENTDVEETYKLYSILK